MNIGTLRLASLWSSLFWLIVFPFIYSQLLTRLFGLNKKIDRWIVFCLHNCGSATSIFLYILLFRLSFSSMAGVYLAFAIILAVLTGLEGLVWQCFLLDRKMNGFLIAFICNMIFLLPVLVLITVL